MQFSSGHRRSSGVLWREKRLAGSIGIFVALRDEVEKGERVESRT